MGHTFTRVAGDTWYVPYLVWAVTAILFATCFHRSYKTGERPWALVLFTLLLSILGMSGAPREAWMQREGAVLVLAGIVAIRFQLQSKGNLKKRLSNSISFMVLPLMLTSQILQPSSSTGLRFVELRPTEIAYRGRPKRIQTDEAGKTSMEVADDRITLVSFGDHKEILFADYFEDELGNYVTGRQVADQVSAWIRVHPFVSPHSKHQASPIAVSDSNLLQQAEKESQGVFFNDPERNDFEPQQDALNDGSEWHAGYEEPKSNAGGRVLRLHPPSTPTPTLNP